MAKIAKTGEKVRAFDNPLLEKLSRIHPAVPLLMWGPLAVGLVYLGHRTGITVPRVAGMALLGLSVWTLTEYALHRWFFHWEPANPRMRRLLYPAHQLHHDVQEWDRIVAPPLMSIPLGLASFGLSSLLLGAPAVFPFFGGFTIGYLSYDFVHLYTHFGRPRSWLGKGLRRRHLQHHHACPYRWYGVSSPLWDYVFRTHLPRRIKPSNLRAED